MRKKFTRIRTAKYFLYKYGIHRFIPFSKLKFLGYVGHVSSWIAKHSDLNFSSFPTKRFDYANRFLLYQYVIDQEVKDDPIDYFEFGVSKGVSFRWWVEKINHSSSRFFGFDTFSGL